MVVKICLYFVLEKPKLKFLVASIVFNNYCIILKRILSVTLFRRLMGHFQPWKTSRKPSNIVKSKLGKHMIWRIFPCMQLGTDTEKTRPMTKEGSMRTRWGLFQKAFSESLSSNFTIRIFYLSKNYYKLMTLFTYRCTCGAAIRRVSWD